MTPAETMGMLLMPTPSTFDRGVGRAANRIGLGLGFEAAKGLLQAFGKPSLTPDSRPIYGDTTTTTVAKRRLL
jgi:hypothetical protein